MILGYMENDVQYVSVVIPFRGDPATVSWVMEGLAEQDVPEGWKLCVRVMGDGCKPPAPPAADCGLFSVGECEWCGVAEAKNRHIEGASCDAFIFLNADTRPERDCVAVHLRRLEALGRGSGCMVLGAAPFERPARATVFDVLKEETPMIFFYPQMKGGGLYDFRHAWTLNLAVWNDFQRLRVPGSAGFDYPFRQRLRPYGHEDIELAFRYMGEEKKVYYEPHAVVRHRHPMTFEQYLNREEGLGLMGPVLHDVNGEVFERLFGTRDLEKVASEFAAWVKMDAAGHQWIWRRMQEWVDLPAEKLGTGEARQRLMMTLYQMHIPLKRLAFRLGFLRGMELRDDAHWKERKAAGFWKKVVQS